MFETFFIIVWLAGMALLAGLTKTYRCETQFGEQVERTNLTFAVIVFLPIFIAASLRGDVGDTYAYKIMFNSIPDTFGELKEYIPTVTKDKGFTALSGVIKLIFGSDTTIYLTIIALFQSAVLVTVYRKYSINYIVSIFLFVASTDYMSWMFNGMRQFMAVTIIFAATGLILKHKWVAVVCVVLLASTMHQSALIMIPFIFIAQGKAWNKRTILFIGLSLAAVMFVDRFTDVLDALMQETQYANMVTDWSEWGDDGTNFFRVMVYSVPTIMSLIGLKFIRKVDNRLINFCTNMSIISTGLYIISMFTSGIFMGRLPIYASLYNYILLPWEIENIFTRNSAKIVSLCMVGGYLAFGGYQLWLTWG